MTQDLHVIWHPPKVNRAEREELNGHKACVVWFTGLSGSGKSTVASLVEVKLFERRLRSYTLDGDNLRHGLSAGPGILREYYGEDFAKRFGLGFSSEEREENIRRIGAVAKLFCDAGFIVLTALISPYRRDRDAVRATLSAGDFLEIFVDTPLTVCEKRDPKGLYKKARAGELRDFTGLQAPYEPPLNADLVLEGADKAADILADELIAHLESRGIIPRSS